MAVNGGIMKDLTITHPTAGTKKFFGIKGEDSTYILGGGYTKENTVSSNFQLITDMQPEMGSFKCTSYNDMSEQIPAYEFLNLCKNSTEEFTVAFTNANSFSYAGSATIEGTPELSGNKMTLSFEVVSGTGFTKI